MTQQKAKDPHFKRNLTRALIAGFAGFLANYLAIGVNTWAVFIFGGIFYLVIAIVMGPWLGLLAAMIASSQTFLAWGHPYAWLVFSLEAWVIGFLVRKRFQPMVASIVFWLMLGMPLMYWFYEMAGDVFDYARWGILLELPLNGFINILFAELLIGIPLFHRWLGHKTERPLRWILIHAFMLAATLPLLVSGWIHGRMYEEQQFHQSTNEMSETAKAIRTHIQDYLKQHVNAITTLAASADRAGDFSTPALNQWLALYGQTYPGFLTMLAADPTGLITAGYPLYRPDGTANLAKPRYVDDRSYFIRARESDAVFLSRVFLGRGFGADPIVAISAPIHDADGNFAGIVEGSLDLAGFKQFGEDYRTINQDAAVLILDQFERAIFASSHSSWEPLFSLSGSPLIQSFGDRAIGEYSSDNGTVTIACRAVCPDTGWQVIITRPETAIQSGLGLYYLLVLGIIVLGLIASYAFGLVSSLRIVNPVVQLIDAVSHYLKNGKLLGQTHLRGPAPVELDQLNRAFNDMVARLIASYNQLQKSLEERDELNAELKEVLAGLDLKVKERTAQLAEAKVKAEEATRSKSAFLANMSHELRTPMNAVIGMTSLLLGTRLEEEQQEYVETIRSSGDSLLSLINDILDFTKIEAGKMELEQRPFDLRSCVEEALDLLAGRAGEKQVDLSYIIGSDVPESLVGDIFRLRQILVNLIGNAVKFTEQGSVSVSVRTLQQTRRGLVLEFAVADTGIGIPKDRLHRLFRSFSQVDSSATRKFGGTGLGLAISKRLVNIMGGDIRVESEKGEGATFIFTIKTWPGPVNEPAKEAPQIPALAGKTVVLGGVSTIVGEMIVFYAQQWGITIKKAGVIEDLNQLLAAGPDLAMIDPINLEMEQFRHPQKTTPLVRLAYLGQNIEVENSHPVAYTDSLTKPIKPKNMYRMFMSLMAGVAFEKKNSPAPQTQLAESLPLRILLAEDNAVNQKVALRMLEKMGYRADLAASGVEVLQALARQDYDVILMDVQMPEMDGLETTRQIRKYHLRNQPTIIAMTANALQGDREICLEAGMDEYISKPIRVEDLRDALSQCAT